MFEKREKEMRCEIILGTIGRWFDSFIAWQFSSPLIAISMCILEFFILLFILYFFDCKFRTVVM